MGYSFPVKNLLHPADNDAILRRLGSIRPDSPRRWGKMTPHQMICHLSDAFLGVMGEKPVSPAPSSIFVKWIALYAPFPWPHGVPTRPEMNQQLGGTPPAEFAADVRKLYQLIDRFLLRQKVSQWVHPMFGTMSQRDWMRWGYLHPDHHLRQFGA